MILKKKYKKILQIELIKDKLPQKVTKFMLLRYKTLTELKRFTATFIDFLHFNLYSPSFLRNIISTGTQTNPKS